MNYGAIRLTPRRWSDGSPLSLRCGGHRLLTAILCPGDRRAEPVAAGQAGPVQADGAKIVTLLTGDKVQVTPAGPAGAAFASFPIDPAQAGYETRTVGKDLYVVPDSAAKLVNNGARSTRRCST